MNKSKIILVGCNLYSIFLALELSKKTDRKIIIAENSNYFLRGFEPIKINNISVNPGFHALEKPRSNKLINYLKKFKIKFIKIKKNRGILLSKYFLNSFDKWPSAILKKYSLQKKRVEIKNFAKDLSKLPLNYLRYLNKNVSNSTLRNININNYFPWFFPKNYKNFYKDEGSLHLEKIRSKKIVQNYYIPESSLFYEISKKIKNKLTRSKSITLHYNTKLEFSNIDGNVEVFINNKKSIKNNFHVICTPVQSTIKSIKKNDNKKNTIEFYIAII